MRLGSTTASTARGRVQAAQAEAQLRAAEHVSTKADALQVCSVEAAMACPARPVGAACLRVGPSHSDSASPPSPPALTTVGLGERHIQADATHALTFEELQEYPGVAKTVHLSGVDKNRDGASRCRGCQAPLPSILPQCSCWALNSRGPPVLLLALNSRGQAGRVPCL